MSKLILNMESDVLSSIAGSQSSYSKVNACNIFYNTNSLAGIKHILNIHLPYSLKYVNDTFKNVEQNKSYTQNNLNEIFKRS